LKNLYSPDYHTSWKQNSLSSSSGSYTGSLENMKGALDNNGSSNISSNIIVSAGEEKRKKNDSPSKSIRRPSHPDYRPSWERGSLSLSLQSNASKSSSISNFSTDFRSELLDEINILEGFLEEADGENELRTSELTRITNDNMDISDKIVQHMKKIRLLETKVSNIESVYNKAHANGNKFQSIMEDTFMKRDLKKSNLKNYINKKSIMVTNVENEVSTLSQTLQDCIQKECELDLNLNIAEQELKELKQKDDKTTTTHNWLDHMTKLLS